MNSEIAVVECRSYDPPLVWEGVRRAIGSLGGISNFVKPNSRVLVKPNLLMAKGPECGITTHPEVIRGVIRALKEIGCKIVIGDGPSVWGNQIENIDDVYEKTGIKRIAYEEGIELIKFDKRRWKGKFPLTAWLDDCDHLVSIPKFKTHNLTLLTGAIKNLFGLIPGTYKTELHKNYFDVGDFSKILVDIYELVKPDLTVIDGIVAMEGDGPATGGKLRSVNLLLAGSDCVALDSILAKIMGLNPADVLTTKEASKRGLGLSDINSIKVHGVKLEEVIPESFLLPTTSLKSRIPRPVINLAKKLIKYYPCVEQDNCVGCAACIQACPNKAIKIKNKRIVFDYSKCIACFCCQEACPNAAIRTKKSLAAKIMGL